jgi:ribosome-binding factor A
MTFKRADRVADLIRMEIADILLRQIGDPRLKKVTVTDVKVTDDLRLAKLYFVEMGENILGDDTKEGLAKAAGYLRRELGKRLQLRHVPELMFLHDESFAYGDRIERLLAGIQEEKKSDA